MTLPERAEGRDGRKRAARSAADLPTRLTALSRELRAAYDTRPVSREEWDAAAGDEGGSASASVSV